MSKCERGDVAVLKRTWAAVSTEAIAANYRAVRRLVGEDCRVMAIVKADGYGHGAVPTAKALVEAGADWLAVSNLCEAAELREAGLTQAILILGYTPPEEAAELARLHITQTVSDAAYAEALEAEAAHAGVVLPVHIKIDTGMSRLGFVYQQHGAAIDEIAAACTLPHLQAEGLFTHFAFADDPDEAKTRHQFALFEEVTNRLREAGITVALRHCCNSAATLRFPEMHLDMVRPGLLLYGGVPDASLSWEELTPAMSLKTVVAQVKTVPAGTAVSYGGMGVTTRETQLATVPIGYADGLPRACSNTATMLVNGERATIVGRVCMDQCVLDVTGLQVQPGDEVVVFGNGLPADALAESAGTIVYEILCRVGQRVPRVYL
ncbi:MAG: alanine racemase [Clostridia bacterium]|nr:alanine racemase [Clostridia bacterium]